MSNLNRNDLFDSGYSFDKIGSDEYRVKDVPENFFKQFLKDNNLKLKGKKLVDEENETWAYYIKAKKNEYPADEKRVRIKITNMNVTTKMDLEKHIKEIAKLNKKVSGIKIKDNASVGEKLSKLIRKNWFKSSSVTI